MPTYDWTQLFPATTPTPNCRTMVYSAGRARPILFSDASADLWTWDASDWAHETPTGSVFPTGGTGFSEDNYLPSTDQLIWENPSGDLWNWDGAAWAQLSPATTYGVHQVPGIGVDEANDKLVFYGGDTGGTDSSETWLWDGTDITHVFPATTPPAIGLAVNRAFAFDRARNELLMVLQSVLFTPDVQVYTWDGTDWTHKTPSTVPPAGSATTTIKGLSYHPPTNTVIALFSNTTSTFEHWSWDGTDFTQVFPANTPSAVAVGHYFVYDETNEYIIGFDFGAGGGETWIYDAPEEPPGLYLNARVVG